MIYNRFGQAPPQPLRSAAFSRAFVRPVVQQRPVAQQRPVFQQRPIIQQRSFVQQRPFVQQRQSVPAQPARPVINAVPAQPRPVVPVVSAVPPSSSWNWLSGPVGPPAGLPVVRSGSLRLGTVAAAAKGADVQIHLTSARGNETAKFSIGAQVNGNWYPLYNIQAPATATAAWQTFTLHLNYEEINTFLHTVNPSLNLDAGKQIAIGATFNGRHNTGMPGWTSNNGSEENIFVTLPPPG
jgi:hypothetical protein